LKRITNILKILFIIIIGLICAIIINFFTHLKKYIPADESEFYSPYYVYISSSVAKKAENREELNILVMPNNTGTTSDNLGSHERVALLQTFIAHIVFKDLNTIILIPAFPRTKEQGDVYTHALDRDTLLTEVKEISRTDVQLNAMVDETTKRLTQNRWQVNGRFMMFGQSASGMFVNRYCLLHPERVSAAVIFSPGGWAIAPVRQYNGQDLRYPIGIDDVEQLVGNKLNLEAYKEIPHLFVIGSEDSNDSVPYSDGYADEDRDLINSNFGKTPIERWKESERLYEAVLINVEFKTYKGMGHIPSLESLKDAVQFLKDILNKNKVKK
jgi:pimeloyl-ACP methyl ester carboxylesterase